MWSNFHTHSTYCDGKKTIAEIRQSGRSLLSLGFSSHAPLPFPRSWCMKPDAFDAYCAEIAGLKRQGGTPQLYAGLEVDFIPGKISPHDFQRRLDYTIGSIHFVDRFDNGEGWEIDGPHIEFQKGFEQIFRNDIVAMVRRYFELTRMMVEMSPPDIVGHVDKIKMQNSPHALFSEDDPWYKESVRLTLDTIGHAGCIVEVSTRGLYQKKTTTTYPSPWVLKEIARRKIPVTLSSDAHHPDDLTNGFPEAAGLLLQLGFKKIRILLDGKWQDVAFDTDGIRDGVSYHPVA